MIAEMVAHTRNPDSPDVPAELVAQVRELHDYKYL